MSNIIRQVCAICKSISNTSCLHQVIVVAFSFYCRAKRINVVIQITSYVTCTSYTNTRYKGRQERRVERIDFFVSEVIPITICDIAEETASVSTVVIKLISHGILHTLLPCFLKAFTKCVCNSITNEVDWLTSRRQTICSSSK